MRHPKLYGYRQIRLCALSSRQQPDVGKVKGVAKKATCVSNEKQLYLCASTYVQDNSGWHVPIVYFVGAGTWTVNDIYWVTYFADFLKLKQYGGAKIGIPAISKTSGVSTLFECPNGLYQNSKLDDARKAYAGNCDTQSQYHVWTRLLQNPEFRGASTHHRGLHESEVKHPGARALIVEGHKPGAPGAAWTNYIPGTGRSNYLTANPSAWPAPAPLLSAYVRDFYSGRHDGMLNSAFFDGHCESRNALIEANLFWNSNKNIKKQSMFYPNWPNGETEN